MTVNRDKALDAAEYAFGAPLFIAVSIVTGAVMAVGLAVMAAFGRVFR
jgi:hypothetical protein